MERLVLERQLFPVYDRWCKHRNIGRIYQGAGNRKAREAEEKIYEAEAEVKER